MLSIYYPSKNDKYVIPTDKPICLRCACAAGRNRSSSTRQFLKERIHPDSIVLPPFGAHYSDHENTAIINIRNIRNQDEFSKVFHVDKPESIQQIFLSELGQQLVEKKRGSATFFLTS